MNDNSSVFYLPGNNLGISVPKIERPITAEDLSAIAGYLEEVINIPGDTEDLYYQLVNRYDYAYSEFYYSYDEISQNNSYRSTTGTGRNKRRKTTTNSIEGIKKLTNFLNKDLHVENSDI